MEAMNYEAIYGRNRAIHNLVREYFKNYGNVLKWRGYKEKILQDGCIDGTLTKVLFPFVESHVQKLVAIDDKEAMIDEAKKHNQLEGVEYRTVDIENGDFLSKVNEKFDHIFSFFLSTYRTDTRNWLEQFSQILNPNGQIFIQTIIDSSVHKALVKVIGDEKWSKYLPSKVVFADYTDDPIEYFRNEAETLGLKVELCEIEKKNFVTDHCSGQKKTSSEGITIVYRGMWRHTKGKKVEVAMKTLKCDYRERFTKNFLDIAGQWVFLQSNAIVRLFGVTLSAQMSMISEYVKFGPLDEYLRNNKRTIKEVDLIEAASNLASAFWHLEENGIVHGKIRCRKLLVHNHDENNFSVKLSDPGISTGYPASDLHWIPIECYNNNNYAKHSTPADVWAFGTTLWEIFMFGEVIQKMDHIEAMKMYKNGKRLPKPPLCPLDIYQLMRECWNKDPHRRKQPQAIMRDINQLMYEVYNSRRVHSYAKINIPHKPSSVSSNSLASQETGTTFVVEELLSMSDSTEIDSDLSVTPDLGNMRRSGWQGSQDDFSSDDTISEFSNFFQNINIPTATTSLDSINSIQSIFELDGEWNVVLQGKIGQGFYGDVYRATLEKIGDEDCEPRQVAVKKLKKAPELSHLQDFEREISIMKGLKHPNIVEILGVLNEPEVSLVMEFVQHGSFQSYLKINKEFLIERQLLKYALDIAMGMAYLGEKKIVHRDLAARNILVVDKNHVKISDFGLAQVVGSNNYYIMKSARDLPIKWYAPESLEEGKFSTCSDVWSYGVTLWEMFSYGQEPKLAVLDGKKIEGQEQQALLKALQSGARYPCPAMCKQAIYASIIHPCWDYDPHTRPTFTAICEQIQLQMKFD